MNQSESTVRKPRKFFIDQLKSGKKHKSAIIKTASVNEKALLASYKVTYHLIRCQQPHTFGEIMLGDNFAKQIRLYHMILLLVEYIKF